MSYKVLHILDCFLPETMNWLEKLLEETMDVCEHHVFAPYYIRTKNTNFHYVNWGMNSQYPIPFTSKIIANLIHSINCKILHRYIIEQEIQLVHFHFGHVAIKYKSWIQKTGIPFCVSLYGFDYEYLIHRNPSIKLDYIKLSKLGGQFIVEGNYSRKLIQNYGIPVQQIHKVHMLFDRRAYQILPHIRTSLAPIRLFQAATYTEKKNQLGLVEALQDRHAGRFIISFYGEKTDKDYFQKLQNAIKQNGKHTILLHDKLSLTEYLQALNEAHIVINLSKRSRSNDTEGGCPVLLKDSLSLGKPCISTNHCDIPELLVHGYNGFLLPENDTNAVTNLLDQLLLISQKEYKLFCRNAEESVNTNIRQKLTRQELIKVYQSLL